MKSNKMKVVISGLIYPWTMLHFFWRAFKRREDVELFVLGPFFDDYIPWNGGMSVPRKYVVYPDLPLPTSSAAYLMQPSLLEPMLPWYPDLWVQIDAGWRTATRPPAEVVAHVQTDPHVLKTQYALPKGYSDLNFCMQGPYMDTGEIYLPYGFDPTIHFSENIVPADKLYDACLIGLQYNQRTSLVQGLRLADLTVLYDIGRIMDEYREAYNKSRMALSWSSLLDMPSRVWEAFGMGIPLLTNRVPDLNNFFVEDDHYLGFDTVDEAVYQAKRLLELDNASVNAMTDSVMKEVYAKHTWDHRVTQLLSATGLIK